MEDFGQFYNDHCTYFPAMIGWFIFSSLLSSYNKYVFGEGHMAFPYPLLMTSMHFLVQWIFSHCACELFPVSLGTDRVKQQMSWKEWALVSIPCGAVTSLDVGLSNLSLVSITITFYTMVKSSTPIFVLGWAYLLGIERITWPLIGVICVIAAGEFLTVLGEVDFVLKGFLLCLSASVLSGARWTLVQKNLQKLDPPLKSTLLTMRLLSPSMFFSLLLFSLVVEQPWNVLFLESNEDGSLMRAFVLGLMGGSLAVSMVLCEFYLILKASAMIMMIGGVIKEMVTIIIGVSLFGDKLNLANVAGMCVVFSGVVLYKVVFHMAKKHADFEEAVLVENLADDDDDEENLGYAIGRLVTTPGYKDDANDGNHNSSTRDNASSDSGDESFELVSSPAENRGSPNKRRNGNPRPID